jgi:hypothetical protein
VVCQYLPYSEACLVLAAKVPERSHKNRLRGQPAWLLDQDARSDVSSRHKITEVKPCPCLVHRTLIPAKRAKSLCLLFILGGFSKIARIAMKHSRHMIEARVAGAEGDRLLSSSQGIIVATLKQARVTQRHVSVRAVRVDFQSTSAHSSAAS